MEILILVEHLSHIASLVHWFSCRQSLFDHSIVRFSCTCEVNVIEDGVPSALRYWSFVSGLDGAVVRTILTVC